MKLLRKLSLMLTVFLPNLLKVFVYKYVFGWDIGKNVSIGISYIDAEKVKLKENVRIGHLNTLTKLKYLELGINSKSHNLNRIVGSNNKHWERTFVAGDHCGITSRHHFDTGGYIHIGDSVIFAGASSQICHMKFLSMKIKL